MKTTSKTNKTLKKKQKCKWVRYKYPSRPEVFEAFAKWLCYPKSVRDPKNQGEFAKLNEISPNSLSSYKKKPEFWKLVDDNKQKIQWEIEDKIALKKIAETMGWD